MLVFVVGVPRGLLATRRVGRIVRVVVMMRLRRHQAGAVETEQLGGRVMAEWQEDLAEERGNPEPARGRAPDSPAHRRLIGGWPRRLWRCSRGISGAISYF